VRGPGRRAGCGTRTGGGRGGRYWPRVAVAGARGAGAAAGAGAGAGAINSTWVSRQGRPHPRVPFSAQLYGY